MAYPITGSILYSLVGCPKRVELDAFGDQSKRDPISPFVQLLWDRGSIFERETIERLEMPFLDLSKAQGDEKEQLTREAMERGELLIYNGRICIDDLVGIPDLLMKTSGGYIPGDIKSGAGEEGADEDAKKPKLDYAVQLSLYVDILEKMGRSAGRRAFVWDIRGDEVIYELELPRGPKTPQSLWDEYKDVLSRARAILGKTQTSKGAYAANCRNCHWYSFCIGELTASDDLTLIPQLGRSTRDSLQDSFQTIAELAEANPERFTSGSKTMFKRIGPETLVKFIDRAKLLKSAHPKPYLKSTIVLPVRSREIFFDIECDPMRDVCYLHGFIARDEQDNSTEKFSAYFADQPSEEEERRAFVEAIDYIRSSQPATIFYYSKYERTIYRKLQSRFPGVCSAGYIDELFDPQQSIDLYYDVVLKMVEFPTRDFSIKTLAKYLGFNWRDTHPSGAASIEWFNQWVEMRDPDVKQRILDYNEDDCRATRVLLDGIRAL